MSEKVKKTVWFATEEVEALESLARELDTSFNYVVRLAARQFVPQVTRNLEESNETSR